MQRCEYWTNKGDAVITGNTLDFARFTQSINNWYQKTVTMVLESQDEWDFDDLAHGDFPIVKTPLVDAQRDYSIPASEKVLKLKRVDITYDGSTYFKAEPIDTGETSISFGDDTKTDGHFHKNAPFYDTQYGSVSIYPRANAADVANGAKIRMEWTREIDEFTVADTTQEPALDEPFHEMLAIGASFDWLLINKPQNTTLITRLEGLLVDYERRLRNHYSTKQEDRKYMLKPADLNYE